MGWVTVTWDGHMGISHGMGQMGWAHGMVIWDCHMGWVTWDGHIGWSHWTVTWNGSYGIVNWDGCYFQPIRGKYLLQNWAIYKMCDIQISDKILKTPRTEMRFSQDSHKLAI